MKSQNFHLGKYVDLKNRTYNNKDQFSDDNSRVNSMYIIEIEDENNQIQQHAVSYMNNIY